MSDEQQAAVPPETIDETQIPPRMFDGWVKYRIERDAYNRPVPESESEIQVSVFIPTTADDYRREYEPHYDPEDPRNVCQEFHEVFHRVLRPKIEPGIIESLARGGFPGVVPFPVRMEDGTIGEHPPMPIQTINIAACRPDSPWSVLLIYQYQDLPPVIIPIPGVMASRAACGRCDGCLGWKQRASRQMDAGSAGG
jgi:hypothetical protein